MGKPEVIVAVRDEESAEGLVKLACQVANGGSGANLMALHVVEVAPGLPLDADSELLDGPGKRVLGRASQVAQSLSVPLAVRLVRARHAGEAIVGEAEDHHADLLVMGYRGSHKLGELLLGSTVKHVAEHAPCRTIIQVPPAGQH